MRLSKGQRERRNAQMIVHFRLEATQPNGAHYRVDLGCIVYPTLGSIMAVIGRLF